MLEDVDLRRRVLDSQVESVKSTLNRARNACLMGNLIAFIAASALYNSFFSWNYGQMNRRAEALHAINEMPAQAPHDPNRPFSESPPLNIAMIPDWLVSTMEYDAGEFSYVRYVMDLRLDHAGDIERTTSGDLGVQTSQNMDDTHEIMEHELKELVKRKVDFDTISLPVIGVDIAATDIGVMGGLALVIVGFWLIGALRKQLLILDDFVISPHGGNFLLTDNYTLEEGICAHKAILGASLFNPYRGQHLVRSITAWIFLFPPIVFLANFISSIAQGYDKFISTMTDGRLVAEILVWVVLASIWFKSWRYERRSERALVAWEDCLTAAREGSNPKKVAIGHNEDS